MRFPIVQVDAFAARRFGGNPAAVVLLERWLPDDVLRSIAAENNLPQTAFVLADPIPLRWFAPTMEIDLCGHATLATGHVLFGRERATDGAADGGTLRFATRSGTLSVTRRGDLLELDLPARPAEREEVTDELAAALGARPREAWRARDLLAVFDTADQVRALSPDFARVLALDAFAVCATAPGDGGADFVSRFFVPKAGVPEDPATGSSHCTLVPYWAARLGRTRLTARQLSPRVGEFTCELRGERVGIAGRTVEFLRGEIEVD
jgi:PhzF family phenazine biosynthesis protein